MVQFSKEGFEHFFHRVQAAFCQDNVGDKIRNVNKDLVKLGIFGQISLQHALG